MQLSDGGWGWFSGYGEFASPHTTALVVHGLQVARQNDLALPQGMLERGIAWLSAYQAKQVQLLQNGDQRGQAVQEDGRRPRCPGVHGPGRRRSSQRRHARLPRPRSYPPLRVCEGHASAWRSRSSARRTSWRWCSRTSASTWWRTTRTRRPISSCPARATGGGGTAARSRPTRSISSCWPAPIPRGSLPRGWSSTSSITASTAPTGTRPATRPSASRPWPITSGPAARTGPT